MRFVITVEDIIWLGLLAIAIVLMLIGFALSLIRKMGEKVINKVSSRERCEDNSEQDS